MAKKKKRRYYVYQTGGGDPIIDFNLPKLDPNAPLNPDEAPVDYDAEKEKFRQMYNDLFMTPEQKNAARMRELESRGLIDRPTTEQDEYDMFGQGDPTLQQSKKRLGLFDPRRTELHPFIRGLNTLTDIATGIGSKINNVKAAKQEQKEYLEALAPEEYENMERYGLNELPIFTKYGGGVYQTGGAAPIITNDSNDPRLKKYNDSLALYNNYQGLKNMILSGGKYYPVPEKSPYYYGDVPKTDKIIKVPNPNNPLEMTEGDSFAYRTISNTGLPSPNYMYKKGISPTGGETYTRKESSYKSEKEYNNKSKSIVDRADGNERIEDWIGYSIHTYKKPVQPIILQEERELPSSKVKGVDMTQMQTVSPSGRPTDVSQKPTKYSVTVRDENAPGKQRSIYFKTKKEWRDFVDSGAVSTISTSETDDSATAAGYQTMKTGGMNFKSNAAYKKWLAYGHASGEFAKTPGNTKVSIKGKPKKVKHQTGGDTIPKQFVTGAEKHEEPDFNMAYYKTLQGDKDALLADKINNLIATGVDPYSKEGKVALEIVPLRYGNQQFAHDLSFKIKALQAGDRYKTLTPEQRLEEFYGPLNQSGNAEVNEFVKRARVIGGSPGAFYQNSPSNPNRFAQKLYDRMNSRPAPTITFQFGGESIPQTKGLPFNVDDLANVEAERGEAYMDFTGEVYQVAEDAKTHEQGGEMLPQVHKVLENTSSLRKDRNSKYLKVDPKQFKAITGVNTTRSMSHAEALVKANETLDKQREHIVKKIELAGKDKNDIDKLAENSIKLNMDHFAAIPTKQEMFDRLFNHQEAVKMAANIPTGEAAKMGGYYSPKPKKRYQVGGFTPYAGNKTGLKTPAGNYDAFPAGLTMDQYLKDLQARGFKYEGITDNKQLQQAIYEYTLQNDPDRVKKMWQEGMHQKGMQSAQQLGFVDDKGRFKPGVLDNPENLRKLGELYPDGDLGIRTLQLAAPPKKPRVWTDNPPAGPAAPQQKLDTSIKANIKRGQQVQSNFFEPLRWYDTASPINAYLASLERIPEKFNPMEFNQLRYKLADPTTALQQNQGDFNAAVQAVQNTTGAGAGVQFANIANLATRKYAMNNQVVGNFENQNAQIKNQEILYNTQVRDKQSAADQQAREVFEDKVLTSKAKQQEQKLTALDALYKTIAENRALNRNGNLIMKMSRAFDQYGNYNGYQTQFGVNPTLGMGAPTPASGKFQPAGGIQGLTPGKSYYNRRTGKTLYFDGINLQER